VTNLVVHILHEGWSLCGKPGLPGDWGPGHKWVARDTDAHGERSEANCPGCLAGYQVWKTDPDRLPEYVDEQRAAHAERAVAPEKLALGGLFAAEGRELLRALFAWRGQGSITRWKTKPSRKLAHLADRLAREYPGTTAELQAAGHQDAIESVLRAEQALTTRKGRARELMRVRDELASLTQLVESLAEHASEDAEDEPSIFSRGVARIASGSTLSPGDLVKLEPTPLPRTRDLLRQLAEKWRREPSAEPPDLELLNAIVDAFEEEDLRE